jgi:hypothetical protein
MAAAVPAPIARPTTLPQHPWDLYIYAATVKTLKKKERQGETQFITTTEVPHP